MEIIGYFLIALPILIVLGIALMVTGWKGLLLIVASVAFILACVFGGTYLIGMN